LCVCVCVCVRVCVRVCCGRRQTGRDGNAVPSDGSQSFLTVRVWDALVLVHPKFLSEIKTTIETRAQLSPQKTKQTSLIPFKVLTGSTSIASLLLVMRSVCFLQMKSVQFVFEAVLSEVLSLPFTCAHTLRIRTKAELYSVFKLIPTFQTLLMDFNSHCSSL